MTRHLIETGVVVVATVAAYYAIAWLVNRRVEDEYGRRSIRRGIQFIALVVGLVVIGYVWGVFSRRTSWAFALLAAGLAFALQEVLGSVAGWFNIMLGGIY